MKNMSIGHRYGEQGNAREISSLLCARSAHSARSSPIWRPVYARKNAQAATNLKTSCNKSVHKMLTSLSCFFQVVRTSWSKLLITCNKLD